MCRGDHLGTEPLNALTALWWLTALSGVDVLALDLTAAKRIGALLGATDTSDVIDGHIAHLVEPGDRLLTSDPHDTRRLLGDRADHVTVLAVWRIAHHLGLAHLVAGDARGTHQKPATFH